MQKDSVCPERGIFLYLKRHSHKYQAHNCFVTLSCDAPESKEKLKGHQISEKFDTNEEFKWNLL